MRRKAFVYRHFGCGGRLLYIGKTIHLHNRTVAHSKDAEWFDSIEEIDAIEVPNEDVAEYLEAFLIHTMRPMVKQRTPHKAQYMMPSNLCAALRCGNCAHLSPAMAFSDGVVGACQHPIGENVSASVCEGQPRCDHHRAMEQGAEPPTVIPITSAGLGRLPVSLAPDAYQKRRRNNA